MDALSKDLEILQEYFKELQEEHRALQKKFREQVSLNNRLLAQIDELQTQVWLVEDAKWHLESCLLSFQEEEEHQMMEQVTSEAIASEPVDDPHLDCPYPDVVDIIEEGIEQIEKMEAAFRADLSDEYLEDDDLPFDTFPLEW